MEALIDKAGINSLQKTTTSGDEMYYFLPLKLTAFWQFYTDNNGVGTVCHSLVTAST